MSFFLKATSSDLCEALACCLNLKITNQIMRNNYFLGLPILHVSILCINVVTSESAPGVHAE